MKLQFFNSCHRSLQCQIYRDLDGRHNWKAFFILISKKVDVFSDTQKIFSSLPLAIEFINNIRIHLRDLALSYRAQIHDKGQFQGVATSETSGMGSRCDDVIRNGATGEWVENSLRST